MASEPAVQEADMGRSPIPALSLWQPWASLIALGYKTIETRPWRTNYRGPLAIHATASIPRQVLLDQEWFGPIGGFTIEKDNPRGSKPAYLLRGDRLSWPYRLPLGAVVATCRLAGCVRTDQVLFDGTQGSDWMLAASPGRLSVHSQQDNEALGDYAAGRYAWLLEDVQKMDPVPATGKQGLWEWRPESWEV